MREVTEKKMVTLFADNMREVTEKKMVTLYHPYSNSRVNGSNNENKRSRNYLYDLFSDISCLNFSMNNSLPSEPADDCFTKPLKVSDRAKIPDNQLTASSQEGDRFQPAYGRLNGDRGDGWCTKEPSGADDWLQVDLGKEIQVCGAATQGDVNGNEWATAFKLSYSSDGSVWTPYQDADGVDVVRGYSAKTNSAVLLFHVTKLFKLERSNLIYLVVVIAQRSFKGTVIATQLTNTSYQFQFLQDTFAFIQPSDIIGTVSEWSCMAVSARFQFLYQ